MSWEKFVSGKSTALPLAAFIFAPLFTARVRYYFFFVFYGLFFPPQRGICVWKDDTRVVKLVQFLRKKRKKNE